MRSRFSLFACLLGVLVALPATAQMRAASPSFIPSESQRSGGEFPNYSGILLGTSEVPANMSPARGYSFADLDTLTGDFSAFAIVRGLTSPAVAAHLHQGAAGTNGPVILPAADVSEVDGVTQVFIGGTLTPAQQTALMAGELYINVHTGTFPGGEVRTQLQPTQSIAEARAAGVGATVTLTAYVERAEGRFAYITDETGGLTIRQTSGAWFDAVQNDAITTGTVVRLTGTLSQFNNLIQINQSSSANDLASFEIGPDVGFNVNESAQQVTLAQIGEDYEGELVYVTGVTITGSGTFTPSTNYPIADGSSPTNPVVLRVLSAVDTEVEGLPIPTGPTTILAIVGQFSGSNPAAGYQLWPIESYDVAPMAAIQVIHNAPDPALATVDVLVDSTVVLDNLAFRDASGPLMLPAYESRTLEVRSAAGATVFSGTFGGSFLAPGGDPLVFTALGVVDPSQFAPNPDGIPTAFTVEAYSPSRQRGPSIVGTLVVHGTPDAPAIDLRSGSTVLVDDLLYSFGTALALSASPATLAVTTADGTPVAQFSADLTAFAGQSLTVLASGFLNPSANQNGPGLALLLVAEDGTTTVLPAMGTGTAEAPEAAFTLGVAPNPAPASVVSLTLPEATVATIEVYDALGRRVATLATGVQAAGTTRLAVPSLAPGVYVVRASAGQTTATTTMTVVR